MTTEAKKHDAGGSGKPIRCGVVGVGRMGQHHARVYSERPDVELVGVVDADIGRAKEIASIRKCEAFGSEAELLEAGVDAVSIAVPTTYHLPTSKIFLEAGVACLIEKPLAQDADTARAIKDLAESTGTCLMVGHIERFNPVIRSMQKLREQGHEVVPRFIEVHRVSPMTFRSVDIGVVMDMMIHDLDVVLWLMGGIEPVEIQASAVAVVTEHEDICNARLTFDTERGPCVANISASRLAMKTERVTRITGENGYIKIDYANKVGTAIHKTANEVQRQEVAEQLRKGADLSDLDWSELVNIEPLAIDTADQLEMEIGAFLDAVQTGEKPVIDAEAGFVNVRTAERIVQATREFMARVTEQVEV